MFKFTNCRILFCLLVLSVLMPIFSFSQNFEGKNLHFQSAALDAQFADYQVFQLDVEGLARFAKLNANALSVPLKLGGHDWLLALEPNPIFSENYQLRVLTNRGLETVAGARNIAFRGTEAHGGGRVRMVFDENYSGGFVEESGETYYLEPLRVFEKTAASDWFVLYPASAVKTDQTASCLMLDAEERIQHLHDEAEHAEEESTGQRLACYDLEMAIASDKSMFNKYGSVGAVEAHNVTVINNIQANYQSSFNHQITFIINVQFVVTGTDPWTNSTDAATFLGSFRTWGNNNGFGTNDFDLGEIWTNRDFNGATVGIAYVGVLCTNNKYHALQDYTANANDLRCMVAHEIGHNFNAGHDANCPPGNFIMCPFVTGSNAWSGASINSINNHIAAKIGGTCLEACGSSVVADFDWTPQNPCQNQNTNFTDMSSGTVNSWNWTFQNGTPATSNQQNPTSKWVNPGTYNVTLSINGGASVKTQQVTVLPAPTANFSVVWNGLTATFTNLSVNANSYLWNFGDGQTSTDDNPMHTYNNNGTFNVSLTATNNCGSHVKTISTLSPPGVDFNASPKSGCPVMSVHFQELASPDATSFVWSFPGGTPSFSTQANPTVTYSTPGSYDVTLIATNASGSNDLTKTDFITVHIPIQADFSYAISGLTVEFDNFSTGAINYLWNFGDGQTSTQLAPIHTYANPGTYTITLTATGICGSSTVSQSVDLYLPPQANFAADYTVGCVPMTVEFTDVSANTPLTWNWSFPGGSPSSSTAQNPTVTYQSAGSYTVSLTVTNPAGQNTKTEFDFITVQPSPVAGFSANVNGATVQFSNSTINATDFEWDFGDGGTSTEFSPTHTYAAEGSYDVVLVATSDCGSSTFTETVSVVLPPVADFSWTPNPATGCQPMTVSFSNASTGGQPTSYSWSFAGGTPATSTQANPNVVYHSPGAYSVTLTVSNGAGTSDKIRTGIINVGVGPTANFSASTNGLTANFSNVSTGANAFSWNFGDGQTSTAPNPSHQYATDGIYTVVLTATNACGNTTASQTVTIVTPPTANFSQTPTVGCAPLAVQFSNASSANAVNFSWSFPGGTPDASNLPNPTVVYPTAGTYSATLIVSNAAGSDTISQPGVVLVNTVPTTNFQSSLNGANASFSNSSSNANGYLWEFGNGSTSTDPHPNHSYATDGTYNVVLTATNGCGSSSATQTLTVVTPPTAGFSHSLATGCAPTSVQFSNASSANAVNFSWSFPGGTPSVSTEANPTVSYPTPGVFSATLIVLNSAGADTILKNDIITVGTTPVSQFSSSTAGRKVVFQNNSTGATSYVWDFGDGQTSTEPNPTHHFPGDGVYLVTLTSSNTCGNTTATQSVTIVTPPTAGFGISGGAGSGCKPFAVQLQNASSTNAVSFEWQFPGGTPSSSTEANPTVIYYSAGTYTVRLIASNAAGSDTLEQTDFIVVREKASVGFTTNISGGNASFSNTSVGATIYFWDFGDGSNSTETNPAHQFSQDGNYTVSLTASNVCGDSVFTQIVSVVLPPKASIGSDFSEGCAPLAVQFQDLSTGIVGSRSWVFEGGTPANSSGANPQVLWNTPGDYLVTLTVSNISGTDQTTILVTVKDKPAASFSMLTGGLSVLCTNASVNADSYFWEFGDGSTSNDANPTHEFSTTGDYTVTLHATNECGTTVFSQTVSISGSAPLPQFEANNQIGCVPFTVQFSDKSVGDPTAWTWSFPGGSPSSSTEQNPSVTYSTSGVYEVSLTATNAFGSQSLTQQNFISVETLPLSNFEFTVNQGTVSFQNFSQNAANFDWIFGDGMTSTETNPTHVYAQSGTYVVTLIASNSCGANPVQKEISITIIGSHEAENWPGKVAVFPNPNDGVFTVSVQDEAAESVDFEVFNALGQRVAVLSAPFQTGETRQQIDLRQLPKSTYTLKVKAGRKVVFRKIATGSF